MKSFIKNIPLPICGLILSVFALGNLLQDYNSAIKNISFLIGSILLLFILLKIVFYRRLLKEEVKNSLIASTFPTLSMAIIIYSTYIVKYSYNLGLGLWLFGILLHIYFLIRFTMNYLVSFDIKRVFPSWFIVYVGIVTASVTAPIYNLNQIGRIIFYFGFISYLILLILVVYRWKIVKSIPEPASPTFAVFAAPASLCLAGYLNSFENKNSIVFTFLFILSLSMYILVLSKLGKLIKIRFYPSFSAFTFPIVISAIAMKLSNNYLISIGKYFLVLKYFIILQEILASLIVIFVFIKYLNFFFFEILNNKKYS
ncbi:MAG: TDT family transporter [Andreesenia angusta]|nr:TDT family transporter [Andreesenia angusta]